MTNTKSWIITGSQDYPDADKLTGEWCRVIKRTPTKLIININGIELPNTQCVYVHYDRIPLTEKQAKQIPELHDEWQKLQKSFDEQYQAIPYTTHAIAKDGNHDAVVVISTNQQPIIHILGYHIDTEDGQTNLYWYDGKASKDSPYHIMRRIACQPTSNSPEKHSTASLKSTHPNKTSTKSSKPSYITGTTTTK